MLPISQEERKCDFEVLYLKLTMKNLEDQYFQSNKDLWNKRTAIHKSSAFYDLACRDAVMHKG